jgi:hypothetical protein
MSDTIDNPLRRRLLAGATAALAAGTAIATKALAGPVESLQGAGDDAELIRLCERLIAWEARYEEICLTIEDDDEANAAAAAINGEFAQIRDRLYELGAPVTAEGRLAFARACLASAQHDRSGKIILDNGGSISSYLAFGLAHSVAGETAA